jgi:hypothetical protein
MTDFKHCKKLILNYFLDRPLQADISDYMHIKTVTQVAKETGKSAEELKDEISAAVQAACPVIHQP